MGACTRIKAQVEDMHNYTGRGQAHHAICPEQQQQPLADTPLSACAESHVSKHQLLQRHPSKSWVATPYKRYMYA